MAAAILLDQAADFRNEGVPSAPASGWTRAYTKSDSGLYLKNSSGVEKAVVLNDDLRLLKHGLQQGVVTPFADARISGVAVNASTGAITFTLSAASPSYVTDSGGLLQPVAYAGETSTLTPTSLPASGYWRAMLLQLGLNGSVSLVSSAAVSNVSVDDAVSKLSGIVLVALPLAYVVVLNTAGSYSLAESASLNVPAIPQDDSIGRSQLLLGDTTIDFGETIIAADTITITLPDTYRLAMMSGQYPAKVTITNSTFANSVTVKTFRTSQQIWPSSSGAAVATYVLQPGTTVEFIPNGTRWYLGAISPRGGQQVQYSAHSSAAAQLGTGGNTLTKVPLNTIDYDSAGWYDTTNYRFKPGTPGYYQITAGVGSTGAIADQNYVDLALKVTGSLMASGKGYMRYESSASGGGMYATVSALVYLNGSTDYVELFGLCAAMAGGQNAGTFNGWITGHLATAIGAPTAGQGIATQARVYRHTALTTAATAWTKLLWDSVDYDPGANMVSNSKYGTGTGYSYVCPMTGDYLVTAVLSAVSSAAGQRTVIAIYKNGTLVSEGGEGDSQATTQGMDPVAADVVHCQAGDYLEVWYYCTTAGLSFQTDTGMHMSVVQVGGTNVVGALSPTAQTADYTAGPGQLVLMTGAHTVTLPNAPMAGSQVAVDALTAAVTVSRGGADTITTPTASAQTSFTVQAGSTATMTYLGGVWYVISSSANSLTPVAASGDTTATANQFIAMTGQHTVTLPTAPALGTQVGIAALTATVMVNRASTDTININGTAAQTQVTVANGTTLVLAYLGGVWYAVSQGGGSSNAPPPARAYRNGAGHAAITTGGWQQILVDTPSFDPGGNMDVATNHRYVCPAAGFYYVKGNVIGTVPGSATTALIAAIFQTGSFKAEGAYVQAAYTVGMGIAADVSCVLQCVAGDTIDLRAITSGQNVTMGVGNGAGNNYLEVVPLGQIGSPSPGQGIATAARAYRTTALNLPTGWTKVGVDTKTGANFDPGGNMDTSAGRYNCPVTGYYQVQGQASIPAGNNPQTSGVAIYKNGTVVAQSVLEVRGATAGDPIALPVTDILYCQAGDYIELYAYNAGAVTVALTVGATQSSYLSVVQVGGTNLVGALSPTAQSANYTAGPGQSVLMTGANTVTLPSAPMAGSEVEIVALTGTVTINRAGTDTINVRGTSGQTTCSIAAGSSLALRYLGGVWYVVGGSQTITPSPWIEVAGGVGFQGAWANYTTDRHASYMKDPLGYVHVRGLVKGGTTGTTILTLPAGYRPGTTHVFTSVSDGAGCSISLNSSGTMVASWSGAMTYVYLDNITPFLAEN